MADDSTCLDDESEILVTSRDRCDTDDSSNSDYLYITCPPGNSKYAELSAEFSDNSVSQKESDNEGDQMVDDSRNVLDSRSELPNQREISRKLYRLKMENEFLKEQMSQVIEIFDEEGCDINNPLVQVSFSHHFLARNYKSDIEAYLCSLLTSDRSSDISGSEEKSDELQAASPILIRDTDSPDLFILENSIDDDDNDNYSSVPLYDSKYEGTLDNKPKNVSKPKPASRTLPSCFNCLGSHRLSECPEEHNKDAIALNKKYYYNKQASRNTPVDTRRTRLFTAGVISDELRKALDLKSDQLPLYIYHMRLLGYPPGWMKEAEVHDSELKMYDSEGKMNDDEDITKVLHPDNGLPKVKYDPSLLIDYPGFNMPTPIGFIDESRELGMPGIQFHQLRCVAELKMASPGKMPYRKRKLPSSAEVKRQRLDTTSLEDMETESLDMEIESLDNEEGRIIDSDDDDAKLCQFIPPLPPEQPNHVPSPPPLPVPLPTFQEDEIVATEVQSDKQIEMVATEEVENSEKLPEENVADKNEILNKKGRSKEKQDELSSTSLKDLEETKQKLLSELRNLWVTAASKDKKRCPSDYKDAHHREYKGSCRECRYSLCQGCRDGHSHQKKDKKRKQKKDKQVPRLILLGDCTCSKLQFHDFAKQYHHIDVFTGDHWKLQTAMFHLKTKDLVIEGNEILIVHLGINDLQLLKENGSLNEIKKYAKRFIEQTVKQVKLLIISAILPSTFFTMTVNYKIQCANFFIRELCKNEGASFLNARKAFMTNGKLDKEFFQKDNFTLSSKGSEKLSKIFYSCFESAILRVKAGKSKHKQKKTEEDANKLPETGEKSGHQEQEHLETEKKDIQGRDTRQEQSFVEWFG